MSNKNLISIAKTLDISGSNESLYTFAGGLLENCTDRENGINMFFDSVKKIKGSCRNGKIDDKNLNHALGKLGKAGTLVDNWCRLILDSAQLQDLTIEEIKYVMAAAARLCKIDEKCKKETPQNPEQKRMSSESAPRPMTTDFFCDNKKCKAKLEIPKEKMGFVGKIHFQVKCEKCGKSTII